MYNTYTENITSLMDNITYEYNMDYMFNGIDKMDDISEKEIQEYRNACLISPMRKLLGRVKEQLILLNTPPMSKLSANKYEFAKLLSDLDSSKLWIYSEPTYTTFREYCKSELSMSAEAVTMYLKVAKVMLSKTAPYNIFGNQNYDVSKLYILSVIPVKTLQDMDIKGVINPRMTARELRAFVLKYKRNSCQ